MKSNFWKKLIDIIFDAVVLIKSFFGLFEVLAGIVFAISGKLIVNNVIIAFAQQEIADDPNDIIANFLIKITSDFTAGSYLFAVVYLIFHGIINLFLVIALGLSVMVFGILGIMRIPKQIVKGEYRLWKCVN